LSRFLPFHPVIAQTAGNRKRSKIAPYMLFSFEPPITMQIENSHTDRFIQGK
jgi:hypothetical protein